MGTRILIVEDDAITAEVLKMTLQREGYAISAMVASGEKALEQAHAAPPDLALLDIILNGEMDGIETGNALRSRWNIPIVYLTANTDQATCARARITEPSAYLLKPFNPRELVITLENALYKHQMEQRLAHLNAVLQAIQKVNQLIIRERNRQKLLQEICDVLIEARGYGAAWIALKDASGRLALLAQAGFAKEPGGLAERFSSGELPGCVKTSLNPAAVLSLAEKVPPCNDCPAAMPQPGKETFCTPLIWDNAVHGVLNVWLPAEFAAQAEERALFKELADDLAFALYRIELEEKQQRAEEALRESEARYRELFENIRSGVAVYEVKENGQDFIFKDFNKAGERIDGDQRAGLIGKSIFEVRPGIEQFGLLDVLRKVWETGEPAYHPVTFYTDNRLTGWYENFVYKLPSGEIVAVFENITERKRAEEDLQKYRERLEDLVRERTTELTQMNERLEDEIIERKHAEAEIDAIARRLRTIIDTVGEGITLSDQNGYFEIFNSKMEAITGYTKEEANQQGGDFLRCIYPDHEDYYQALAGIQEIIYTGGSRDVETRIRAKDRTLKTLLVSTALMQYQRQTWFLSAYRDISGRKQIEQELQAAKDAADVANQAKSEFLANMSHELRTPLNAILGYAQILLTADNLTERQRKGLDTIKSSGEHLLTLINEILDLSKIEAGRMDLQTDELHLPEFLKSIADLMRIRAEQKGITFVDACDPDLPQGVRADEKRLREVLVNLLENAIKFTERGTVTLRVSSIDNYQLSIDNCQLRFEVEDTGIGIAPEKLDEIFLPFQQIREPYTAVEGTGLGLAISRRLVAMMGGELHVQSTVGQGSIFGFALHLPEIPDFIPPPKPYGRRIIGYHGEQRTILVVDDEQTNRDILVGMLLPLGFKVVEAANGQEGMAQALQCQPALILLDLRMPVLDGFGTMQQFRQTAALRDVPVVAISASVFEETRRRALAIGFNDFLVKPFHQEELLELLDAYLQVEWIYADLEPPTPIEPPRGSEDEPCPPLPADVRTALLEFATMGMAKDILTVLNTLEEQNAQDLPLIKKLRQFVNVYQFERIIELLASQEKQT